MNFRSVSKVLFYFNESKSELRRRQNGENRNGRPQLKEQFRNSYQNVTKDLKKCRGRRVTDQ